MHRAIQPFLKHLQHQFNGILKSVFSHYCSEMLPEKIGEALILQRLMISLIAASRYSAKTNDSILVHVDNGV